MSRKNTKSWTDEEVQILRDYYNKVSTEEILKMLPNRDIGSIRQKVSKAKITKRQQWTEAEVETLERLYPTTSPNEIVKHLNEKTVHAIRSKAKLMKLQKLPEADGRRSKYANHSRVFSEYEESVIRLYYPYGGYRRVQEELPARTKESIMLKANKMGIKYDKYAKPIWEREEEEIEDFGTKRLVVVKLKLK